MRPTKQARRVRRSRLGSTRASVGGRVGGEAAANDSSSVQALHAGSTGKVVLHPEPAAEKSSLPSFKDWVTVPLTNHNTLPAHINGRQCVMYVDCGTTSAMMAHRVADKLGLLEKVAYIKHYELQLWSTKVRHNLKVVEGVQVQLVGGVSLTCTFLVLPEDMVTSLPSILLDNATLRQAGAMQEFTTTACILYFPNKKPLNTSKKGKDSQYVMDVAMKRRFLRHKMLSIHVDTGATAFYVSPKCLHTRLCLPRVPGCVSLVLAKGVTVSSGQPRTAGTNTFDFVLGKEMLAKYRCVLDFASDFIYFQVDDRVLKVKLRKTCTV